MSSLSEVFLGVIALCALVQALFVGAVVMRLLKAAAQLDVLVARAEEEWPRVAQMLTDATTQIAHASARAEAVAARTEGVLDAVASATERASDVARAAARLPLAPVRTGTAIWHALRRAIAVYRGHPDVEVGSPIA